jgi:phenylalanine ammonia-lyase
VLIELFFAQLMSAHIFALCQAADLRAMEATFRKAFFVLLEAETIARFPTVDGDFIAELTKRSIFLLKASTDQDSTDRFDRVASELTPMLLCLLDVTTGVSVANIEIWRVAIAKHAERIFNETRETFVPGSAESGLKLLGGTQALYAYVRGELGVKIHWGQSGKDLNVIGTEIGKVYGAWASPKMPELLVSILVS